MIQLKDRHSKELYMDWVPRAILKIPFNPMATVSLTSFLSNHEDGLFLQLIDLFNLYVVKRFRSGRDNEVFINFPEIVLDEIIKNDRDRFDPFLFSDSKFSTVGEGLERGVFLEQVAKHCVLFRLTNGKLFRIELGKLFPFLKGSWFDDIVPKLLENADIVLSTKAQINNRKPKMKKDKVKDILEKKHFTIFTIQSRKFARCN